MPKKLLDYDMPKGVNAALLRLLSACRRDRVDKLRVDVHDNTLGVFVEDHKGEIRYLQLINREFYEAREVE